MGAVNRIRTGNMSGLHLHIFNTAFIPKKKNSCTTSTAVDVPPKRPSPLLNTFTLFVSLSQIYYTGKYQSLGIKQGGPSAGKWVELPVTKSPKIIQFSVGHDGSHALLVAEDGNVFFTGSASKGEDGESSKIICRLDTKCWCKAQTSSRNVCYFPLQLKAAGSPSHTSPRR